MTEELQKRFDECKENVRQLNQQLNECYCELDRILVESGDDYRGSYVLFHETGDDYIFMRVETQTIRNEGRSVQLQGPAIRLCDNPLQMDMYDDGIDSGSYDEYDIISFNGKALGGNGETSIHRITKKDMKFAIDYYHRMMKENIL